MSRPNTPPPPPAAARSAAGKFATAYQIVFDFHDFVRTTADFRGLTQRKQRAEDALAAARCGTLTSCLP